MATPQEKLVESLEALRAFQDRGVVAIRAANLKRVHRERLLKNGFLQKVMKGWYVPARPDEVVAESTAWYASFWGFCAAYLRERFGSDWCLSPEHSLSLHAGNWAVPPQLLVRSPRSSNKATALPYGTSLFDVRATVPEKKDMEEKDGLRLFSLPAALTAGSPAFFENNATDARSALAIIRDASEVLDRLLDGGHSTVAGRLAGAFRNIGRDRIANDIVKTMRAAGYTVREQDLFKSTIDLVLPRREASPYAGRIHLMWRQMRGAVIKKFPAPPGRPKNIDAYLKRVQEVYVTDAYHSLSIEGYRVSPALIERVRSGNWHPETNEQDREHRNALAARGYWLAYQAVEKSLWRVLRGENPGAVADEDHRAWYRELFAPSVTAGLLRAADLAGYRNGPVFIRRSMHIPPNPEAVRDAMPVFFEMLTDEAEPSVRVVLGHFIFVYIHPYMDGNGRIGRLLMNVMLAAGGYPWTVVPLERRETYMAALEEASVRQDIVPFADFISQLVHAELHGKIVAKVPAPQRNG
ncbi:MAG: Fic family protein [Candidatus Methylomirabilales bacterium]